MSDRLANQIAAGEVVQRPASVAKELIENAIDAGASSIELIVKDAGSTLVQVVDDGCGMSREDAVRSFQRHATSKISSVDDLERIRTLGFRGEALASIASVAQVELKTKRVEDEMGTQVRVEGGDVTDRRPCGTANGTSVAVRNLFYNVPARRNFLKTPATELKHLTDTFQFLALSNPDLAFRMTHNGNELYTLSAARDDDFFKATRERIGGLFGEEYEAAIVAVDDQSSDVQVAGFVGEPSKYRSSPSEQFLYVNERHVESRYLSHAVKKAYGERLPDKAYPFFALFLDMDPQRVDVNVHPAKAEVKFDDESGVYGFLTSAVRRALRAANVTPEFTGDDSGGRDGSPSDAQIPASGSPTSFQPRRSTGSSGSSGGSGSSGSGSRRSGNGASSSGGRSRRSSPPGSPSGRAPSSGGASPGEQSEALYGQPSAESQDDASALGRSGTSETPSDESSDSGGRRPLWSVHDTYLLTPTDEGLLMVDQRAAHIRVLYERALRRVRNQHGESQQLLFPHTIDLQPSEVDLLEELMPDLRALGFDLERLSGRTVAVRGVPVDVREGDERTILKDLLTKHAAQERVEDERRKHLAKTIAQQSAVRRGQPLSDAERRALMNDLFRCEMPYADPSGHPTLVRLSLDELGSLF